MTASDVDPDRYKDVAEPGLFGLDCFDSMVGAGHDIDGYLFIDQHLALLRPPRLGEHLAISGRVESLVPVPRGMLAQEVFQVHDKAGRLCMETRLRGIVEPLPDRPVESRMHPFPSRTKVPTENWLLLESKVMTPDKVRAFSEDVGNDLHFDPEAAKAYGFRAPLAQGVMTAVYLIGALARRCPPERMDIRIEFLRPVFWDSPVSLWWHETQDDGDGHVLVQSRNEAGKATANLIAKTLSYG